MSLRYLLPVSLFSAPHNNMSQPPFDVDAFADSLHALLATPPPFLSAPASAISLPVLTQLLQPDFLNGSNEAHSVWRALQQLPPPSDGFGGAAKSSVEGATATSPHLALAFSGGARDSADLEPLDDGSCCISCALGATSADQLELAPHSITLVEVPLSGDAFAHEVTTKWWELPRSGGKKLHRQKRLVARKVRRRKIESKAPRADIVHL
jgi:hypothetical protein